MAGAPLEAWEVNRSQDEKKTLHVGFDPVGPTESLVISHVGCKGLECPNGESFLIWNQQDLGESWT